MSGQYKRRNYCGTESFTRSSVRYGSFDCLPVEIFCDIICICPFSQWLGLNHDIRQFAKPVILSYYAKHLTLSQIEELLLGKVNLKDNQTLQTFWPMVELNNLTGYGKIRSFLERFFEARGIAKITYGTLQYLLGHGKSRPVLNDRILKQFKGADIFSPNLKLLLQQEFQFETNIHWKTLARVIRFLDNQRYNPEKIWQLIELFVIRMTFPSLSEIEKDIPTLFRSTDSNDEERFLRLLKKYQKCPENFVFTDPFMIKIYY